MKEFYPLYNLNFFLLKKITIGAAIKVTGTIVESQGKGQKVEITYSFDENQIMHCEFLDVESGRKEKIDLAISKSNTDSETDIDQFLVE